LESSYRVLSLFVSSSENTPCSINHTKAMLLQVANPTHPPSAGSCIATLGRSGISKRVQKARGPPLGAFTTHLAGFSLYKLS
jgi:hypothetical protein